MYDIIPYKFPSQKEIQHGSSGEILTLSPFFKASAKKN